MNSNWSVSCLSRSSQSRDGFGSMVTHSKPGTSYKFRIKMASSTVKFDDHLVSNMVYNLISFEITCSTLWYMVSTAIDQFQFHFSWELGLFTLPHVIKYGKLLNTTKARSCWYIHALLHAELSIVGVTTYILRSRYIAMVDIGPWVPRYNGSTV